MTVSTTRVEVDQRIACCEACRDTNRDHPALVELMDARIDLLHELHDALPIPEPRDG